jgi:hypothetical protein
LFKSFYFFSFKDIVQSDLKGAEVRVTVTNGIVTTVSTKKKNTPVTNTSRNVTRAGSRPEKKESRKNSVTRLHSKKPQINNSISPSSDLLKIIGSGPVTAKKSIQQKNNE